MARAVRDFDVGDYIALTAGVAGDVERMNPRALKTYLQRRLNLIDLQIRMLSGKAHKGERWLAQRWGWSQKPLGDRQWASLADWNYLLATRDALARTIETLS